MTWGEPTIHAAPARESPPRSAAFAAEPGGAGGGWAPASHARPLSIVRDSGVQLAGALRRTAGWPRRAIRCCDALRLRTSAAALTRAALRAAAVDEARYALQSLSAANALEVRRSAAVVLVTLAADPDTRRLLRSHRLSPLILVRPCGV